jgi:glycine/D-amino acid oxidase-like deaminating enzyme
VLGVESTDWLVALPDAIPLGADLGSRVEVLDADGAHAIEPELGEVGGALRLANQARVHPLVAASALANRAGAVATGVAMVGVESTGGRVTTVRTSAGNLHPGAVVFATGLAPSLDGFEVPQQWIKGHLLATSAAPFRLRTALAALSGLVVQLPTGELVAGGTLDEGDDDPIVRPAVIEDIRSGLAALVPRTADLEVAHAWCCFRPATADHQPVIDRVPGLENAWVTCGHFRTGILMAPATGDAIARWIATGSTPPEVGAFGVERFANG